MITRERMDEILDVLNERDNKGPEKWCSDEGIEMEVMSDVLSAAVRTFNRKALVDGEVNLAVVDVCGQAFMLGWEAHKHAS